jgi:hypothetical protein
MGFGGGGGGGMQMGDWMGILQAQQARQEEEMRQARINDGRKMIDQQFDLFNKNKAYFDRYRQGITDYHAPQIARQYADANKNLTFSLADAGTLRSSAAADATADLVRQKDAAQTSLNAKADSALGDLRNQIASNKDTAINQLMATEDPSAGVNTALNQISNIQLAKPDLSPLGQLFSQAAIGGANALKSWQQGGGGFGGNESSLPTSGGGFGNSGKFHQ